MNIFENFFGRQSALSLSSLMMSIVVYVLSLLLLWLIVRLLISSAIKGFTPDNSVKIATDPFLNGVYYAVSYWTEKGGRPYQEDRYHAIKGTGSEDSSLYGVFDGHGGFRAAQYCKENLLNYVISDKSFCDDPSLALKNSFIRTDAEFSSIARQRVLSDGTTAVTAVIQDNCIYVANAGDSRAILVQKGGVSKYLSIDHKPNREDEEKRIKSLGGEVIHWGRWRVQGVLAVSRAIGDVTLQPYVTCRPEILQRVIGPEDEYLVLASDGLWDVMENNDVSRLAIEATKRNFLASAKELCSEALIMGSTDNVTVMIIDLRNRQRKPSLSS